MAVSSLAASGKLQKFMLICRTRAAEQLKGAGRTIITTQTHFVHTPHPN
jgi:hypothetical protein